MPSSHDHYDDAVLRDILATVKTIAVVGASADARRPSFVVIQFLRHRGYQVYGVNPGLGADAIAGVPIVPRLADLPDPVDMIDVFRNTAAVPGVVDEVLAMRPRPTVIWTQFGVRDDAAAARAEAAGLTVIMDRCPKIEIERLGLA